MQLLGTWKNALSKLWTLIGNWTAQPAIALPERAQATDIEWFAVLSVWPPSCFKSLFPSSIIFHQI
jgi:hypothetical protein